MRHDRIRTVISGANPISIKEAACGRGPCPRRAPARSRAPANFKHDPEKCEAVFRKDHAPLKARTAARLEARLATMRAWGDGAPVKCGRRPIRETRFKV